MGRLFGTDGARGVANTELTCELAMNIGRAAAMVLPTRMPMGTQDCTMPRTCWLFSRRPKTNAAQNKCRQHSVAAQLCQEIDYCEEEAELQKEWVLFQIAEPEKAVLHEGRGLLFGGG